ncbi:hypothetical protein NKG05_14640 [Oerskovia sp. M15]
MADTLEDVRALARTQGAATALSALASIVPLACVPGGYVLLPEDLTPPDGAVRVTDVPTPEAPLTVWHVPHAGGDRPSDHLRRPRVADRRRVGPPRAVRKLLETASARLRGRAVAGTATIDLPPVRLAIADAVLAHLTSRALLSTAEDALPATTLGTVAAALDDSGRAVLNLFGASGYLDDAPGRLARAAELLGHASGTVPMHRNRPRTTERPHEHRRAPGGAPPSRRGAAAPRPRHRRRPCGPALPARLRRGAVPAALRAAARVRRRPLLVDGEPCTSGPAWPARSRPRRWPGATRPSSWARTGPRCPASWSTTWPTTSSATATTRSSPARRRGRSSRSPSRTAVRTPAR